MSMLCSFFSKQAEIRDDPARRTKNGAVQRRTAGTVAALQQRCVLVEKLADALDIVGLRRHARGSVAPLSLAECTSDCTWSESPCQQRDAEELENELRMVRPSIAVLPDTWHQSALCPVRRVSGSLAENGQGFFRMSRACSVRRR
jgi:hypothetical protein